MNNINFNIINTDKDYQILRIDISGNGIISHEKLIDLKIPEQINKNKGVIIYGKAPVWLYSFYLTNYILVYG